VFSDAFRAIRMSTTGLDRKMKGNMRIQVPAKLFAAFVVCSFLPSLEAQIIRESLRDFPAQTESLEYDNLAKLRALPNYKALKERFTGKPLQRVQTALARIDLPESEVQEIVMATSPAGFYGLIAGTFNGEIIAKNALKKGCSFIDAENEKILLPTSEMAVLFLGNSLAAFGTSAQIKNMLESRKGAAPNLNAKTSLVQLLNQTDRESPVRGISSGSQIAASLTDAMQGETSLNIDWSRLASNVSAFAYSVKLDTKAHVVARLQCQSPAAAAVLHQMLSAVSALQSVVSSASVENLEVSSSGVFIDLKMDTPLPAS
jgi:hypothetical protein